MKKFANLYLALVFVIIYLPIFYLIAFSFNSGGDMNSFTGFTLDNYQSMFSEVDDANIVRQQRDFRKDVTGNQDGLAALHA